MNNGGWYGWAAAVRGRPRLAQPGFAVRICAPGVAHVRVAALSCACTHGRSVCTPHFAHPALLRPTTVFANYMYDNFSTSLTTAGALASTFGLSNLVSRPAGGWLSDTAARRRVRGGVQPAPRGSVRRLHGRAAAPLPSARPAPQVWHARPPVDAVWLAGWRRRLLLRPVSDGQQPGRYHGHGSEHGGAYTRRVRRHIRHRALHHPARPGRRHRPHRLGEQRRCVPLLLGAAGGCRMRCAALARPLLHRPAGCGGSSAATLHPGVPCARPCRLHPAAGPVFHRLQGGLGARVPLDGAALPCAAVHGPAVLCPAAPALLCWWACCAPPARPPPHLSMLGRGVPAPWRLIPACTRRRAPLCRASPRWARRSWSSPFTSPCGALGSVVVQGLCSDATPLHPHWQATRSCPGTAALSCCSLTRVVAAAAGAAWCRSGGWTQGGTTLGGRRSTMRQTLPPRSARWACTMPCSAL